MNNNNKDINNDETVMLLNIAKQFSWTLGQTIGMEDYALSDPKEIVKALHDLNKENVTFMKQYGIDIYDELTEKRGYNS